MQPSVNGFGWRWWNCAASQPGFWDINTVETFRKPHQKKAPAQSSDADHDVEAVAREDGLNPQDDMLFGA